MSFVIQELEEGIRRLIDIHGKTSKATVIRELFEPLTDAVNDGIGLELLSDYLSQQGLTMSKHYLRNTLYRIRKERGISPQKRSTQELNIQPQIQHQKTTSNNSLVAPKTNADKKALFDAAMKKHAAASNLSEKFLALGGETSDIVDKPDSQIRHIYTRHKIKFNRLYDEFI
jgi:hypothetical protein